MSVKLSQSSAADQAQSTALDQYAMTNAGKNRLLLDNVALWPALYRNGTTKQRVKSQLVTWSNASKALSMSEFAAWPVGHGAQFKFCARHLVVVEVVYDSLSS